jgi:hypothetical protein
MLFDTMHHYTHEANIAFVLRSLTLNMFYEKMWNGEDCINVFIKVIWMYAPWMQDEDL